ncbi:MAG TPA: RNA 2',3'-cyclic phosphodiesterase [Pirellulaceae bacterium]|nr:RNA 2',3'-cyclic phosphodiesterase [Pirellulaceae bacterium]
MARLRTFIAVELAGSVLARAAQLIKELQAAGADVNWVKAPQMHLTLKFLGDVADTETPDICRVVADVASRCEPFEIVCRGAGAFPDLRQPRTIWLGFTQGVQELTELQRAIDDALKKEMGYGREQRRFHPHLTLGRVKRFDEQTRSNLAGLLQKHATFDGDLSVIEEVVVFASFLGRSGPTHEALGRAELSG